MAVVVVPVMAPVPVVTVVVMVMAVVMHMMVMATVMAAAVHHHPMTATAATVVAAAALTGFSTRGEGRQADNDRCGKGKDCSALEHFRGSFCSAGAHPRTRALLSLKARFAAVLAITRKSNPAPSSGGRP